MKANEAQESQDWMQARCGMFTASRSADLMAKTKTGPSASRGNLLTLLAVERLTGCPVETFQNDAMRRGTELEAEARDMYAFTHGVVVEESGYIAASDLPNCGCSPDGLIDADGLLEIKCPASMAKHLAALRTGDHAKEYHWQLQHQLLVTGRTYVDAASYDPRFPEGLQLAVVRVFRDEPAIAELVTEIKKADAEVSAMVAELNNMKEAA